MRIECPRRSPLKQNCRWSFRLEHNQLPARQRPRGLARAFHRPFELLQIVRPRMQFEKRMQLALSLDQLTSTGLGANHDARKPRRRMPAKGRDGLPDLPPG